MSHYLDYPHNKSYSQTHTDISPGGMRSNLEFLKARLQQLESEASEIREAIKNIEKTCI